MLAHRKPQKEIPMNLLPVFSAIAIVATAYLGIDNPGRAIAVQLCIAFVTLLGMGISLWRESRVSAKAV
jgi:hypothetical protein